MNNFFKILNCIVLIVKNLIYDALHYELENLNLESKSFTMFISQNN